MGAGAFWRGGTAWAALDVPTNAIRVQQRAVAARSSKSGQPVLSFSDLSSDAPQDFLLDS